MQGGSNLTFWMVVEILHHEKSPDPCERCYSVCYNRNGTTRIRSNTNLGWNNILFRLQICIHTYMQDSKRNGGYFQPIRSGIKNSRWRRPWKCNHVGKQHWGGPGIDFNGDNFKIDTLPCSPKRSLWSLTIGRLLNQTFHISKRLIWRAKISGFYRLHTILKF